MTELEKQDAELKRRIKALIEKWIASDYAGFDKEIVQGIEDLLKGKVKGFDIQAKTKGNALVLRLKDELTQLEFQVEKLWKVVIDTQTKMGELEDKIRTDETYNLVQ